MKKMRSKKTLAALLAVLTLLAALVCVPAYAAEDAETVTVQLSPHYTIVVDGVERTFYNVQGKEVHPLVYRGTTYLPLRAIGELMDKNVDWNQTTKTATLSGSRGGSVTKGTADPDAEKQTVTASLRYDFTIIVDGVERTFTDVNGNRVYPLLYNGSTYLPLRAIGNLMGKTVTWDGETCTATLSGGEDSLVTDADTFGQAGSQTGAQTGTQTDIGEAKAKSIALNHAGLTESQATFLYVKRDYDDGRWEYEVEFYKGTTEYDYEIDAATGTILSVDYDAEHYVPSGSQSGTQTDIGEAKAKSIALSHAGLTESQVTFVMVERDWDDGRWEYEVEFYKGTTEYDYEIDGATGTILSVDYDAEHYTPSGSQSGSDIGEAKAKSIALERAGVTESQIQRYECKRDYDDGRWKYEVEFRAGSWEYELDIDAATGTVLSYDKDWD